MTDNSMKICEYFINNEFHKVSYKNILNQLGEANKHNWNIIIEIITYLQEQNITIDFDINEYVYKNLSKYSSKYKLDKDVDEVSKYFNDIQLPVLSASDEKLLFTEYQKTKNKIIRDIILVHNLKLVVSIAKKYYYSIKSLCDIEFLDLIQMGNLGLFFAIDTFDPSLGYKFSTYATRIINQYIYRHSLSDGKNIKVPAYVTEYYIRIQKAIKVLSKTSLSEPTIDEIANYIETHYKSKEPVVNSAVVLKYLKRYKSSDTISLNLLINDEDSDDELINIIQDTSIEPMEDMIEKTILKEIIHKGFVKCLTTKETQVLKDRFGFNDEEESMSLSQLAYKYGVTRERIRQIELHAKYKIKRYLNECGITEDYFT